jgi:NAD(P)-dependent dehydrogenase (short-subunit alcohol dehydrogenase family)
MGEAIARKLASEEARLVLLAAPDDLDDLHRLSDELIQSGADVDALTGDISEPSTSKAAVDVATRKHGRLDYLVNNAGVIDNVEFFDETLEGFERLMGVNTRGMYLLAMEASRAMTGDGGGAIVCTASTSSFVGEELQVSYNVSKGAVLMLIKSLALELAAYGIRVNGVAPGYIRTRLNEERLSVPAYWNKARTRIPLDRPGEPEEVANVIAFLLSDDASFMYGSVVMVDGGQSAGYRSTDWDVVDRDTAPRLTRRIK